MVVSTIYFKKSSAGVALAALEVVISSAWIDGDNMFDGSRSGDNLADGWIACGREITYPHHAAIAAR